ncbi:MAG: GxxExxY protein [Chitinophagales bacterium]
MTENEIAKIVFDKGLIIHRALGPGLLESAYEECLFYELKKHGLMVENKFIIEIKSVESLNDLHMAQILTYLKLSNCKLGLLINFNTVLFKDGVRRVIHGTL